MAYSSIVSLLTNDLSFKNTGEKLVTGCGGRGDCTDKVKNKKSKKLTTTGRIKSGELPFYLSLSN